MAFGSTEGRETKIVKENSTFFQVREILESLAVALFLAFLFKSFEAEAFVIPTGSMAPTLKGRHKDVVCCQCGYHFQTSASEEIDSTGNRRSGLRVVAGECPQCRFVQYFGDEKPSLKNDTTAQSYTGDRILVSKMTFDQRPLERWDVSVFRSPSDPKINFIKRIVGLPNENLRVQYGDLFVQKIMTGEEKSVSPYNENSSTNASSANFVPDVNLEFVESNAERLNFATSDSNEPFVIARKDYKYLQQILQVVYDEDYSVDKLRQVGWPDRWMDDLAYNHTGKNAWVCDESKCGHIFCFNGNLIDCQKKYEFALGSEADVSPLEKDDTSFYWLRYRHIIPSSEEWRYLVSGEVPPRIEQSGVIPNNPRLIDDFSAYNAGISRRQVVREEVGNGGRGGKLVSEWELSKTDEFSQLARVTESDDCVQQVYCDKNPDGFGYNWVGDLAVSCDLKFENFVSDSDQIIFELVKGGLGFRCTVSPFSGLITLSVPSINEFELKSVSYQFQKGKIYNFVFLNVDEEMRVVIDDKELVFPEGGGRYDHLASTTDGSKAPIPRNRDPNYRDLAPVAIGVRGCSVNIGHLKVLRDVYYIAAGRMLEKWNQDYSDFPSARCDRLLKNVPGFFNDEDDLACFMSSPNLWVGYGNTKSVLLTQHSGQYVAFGDNSGFSLDSRLWGNGIVPHYVDRKYLIGKAFYVYWPHGKDLPIVKYPFWPNFAKMRHID